MGDDRFSQLTERQRECLRLVAAGLQIKQIATKLDIAQSTVNQRLGRARDAIGANNSRDAARLFAEHEQTRGVWIPPTGSWNPLPDPSFSPPDDPDAAIGSGPRGDEIEDREVARLAPFPIMPSAGGLVIKWPFPSPGRLDNDLNWKSRLGWVVPIAILSLLALLGLVGLSVGVQDSLVGIQHGLARLH